MMTDPTILHSAHCTSCDAWTSDADTLEDGVCGECLAEMEHDDD